MIWWSPLPSSIRSSAVFEMFYTSPSSPLLSLLLLFSLNFSIIRTFFSYSKSIFLQYSKAFLIYSFVLSPRFVLTFSPPTSGIFRSPFLICPSSLSSPTVSYPFYFMTLALRQLTIFITAHLTFRRLSNLSYFRVSLLLLPLPRSNMIFLLHDLWHCLSFYLSLLLSSKMYIAQTGTHSAHIYKFVYAYVYMLSAILYILCYI